MTLTKWLKYNSCLHRYTLLKSSETSAFAEINVVKPHIFVQTRAPRGTDRSPEYNEHFCYKLDSKVKNLTTEWNQKQQYFITHASKSLLSIRFVAVAFRSEEEVFLRGGTPRDLFCLALDPPLGRYGQNIFMHVPGHEHFIPTKFRKHPLNPDHEV